MKALRQLLYLSRAAANLTDLDVHQILHISRRNNRRHDITGCLLFTGAHFAQALEGEATVIESLVNRIALDSRHSNLLLVLDRDIKVRRFPNWAMGGLYRYETSAQVEGLLSCGQFSAEVASQLLDEIKPDAVIGSL